MDTLGSMVNVYSEKLKYAHEYYEVLTIPSTYTEQLDIETVGTVTLKILFGKNFKRRVLMSRSNGKGFLKNTKKLKHKNNKIYLENISENKKYEIEFELNYPISCSMEAKVYGY